MKKMMFINYETICRAVVFFVCMFLLMRCDDHGVDVELNTDKIHTEEPESCSSNDKNWSVRGCGGIEREEFVSFLSQLVSLIDTKDPEILQMFEFPLRVNGEGRVFLLTEQQLLENLECVFDITVEESVSKGICYPEELFANYDGAMTPGGAIWARKLSSDASSKGRIRVFTINLSNKNNHKQLEQQGCHSRPID